MAKIKFLHLNETFYLAFEGFNLFLLCYNVKKKFTLRLNGFFFVTADLVVKTATLCNVLFFIQIPIPSFCAELR